MVSRISQGFRSSNVQRFLGGASQAFRPEPAQVQQQSFQPEINFEAERQQRAREAEGLLDKRIAKEEGQITARENNIRKIQERVKQLKQQGKDRQAREVQDIDLKRARDALDREKSRVSKITSSLESFRDEAQTGQFVPESVLSAGLSRAGGLLARAQFRRDAKSRQKPLQTTQTERALGMSLPAELRNLSPEEVSSGQTFFAGQSRLPSSELQRADRLQRQAEQMQSLPEPSLFEATQSRGLSTQGRLRQEAIDRAVRGEISQFESLTGQEAQQRALSGELGFVGLSTPTGTEISFDPSQRESVRKFLPKDEPFIKFGKTSGIDPFRTPEDTEFLFKDLTPRERVGTAVGSVGLGLTKFLTGSAEFGFETGRSIGFSIIDPLQQKSQGGFFERGETEFFDRGRLGRIKQQPSDPIQIATQVGANVGFFIGSVGVGAVRGAKVFSRTARAQGLGVATEDLIGGIGTGLSPIKLKEGTFTLGDDVVRSQLAGRVKRETTVIPSGESFAVSRGLGEDVRLTSIGFAERGGLSSEITQLERPFIQLRKGKVTEGTLTDIRKGSFSPKDIESFPSVSQIDRGRFVEFPETSISRDVSSFENIFSGKGRSIKDTVATTADDFPIITTEKFRFGTGRNVRIAEDVDRSLVNLEGFRFNLRNVPTKGRPGGVRVEGVDFVSDLSGGARVTRFNLPPRTRVSDDIKLLRGGGGRRTPFSQTFAEQQQLNLQADFQAGVGAGSNLNKILGEIPKSIQSTSSVGTTVLESTPLINLPSAFAGTGQFERTQDFSFQFPKQRGGLVTDFGFEKLDQGKVSSGFASDLAFKGLSVEGGRGKGRSFLAPVSFQTPKFFQPVRFGEIQIRTPVEVTRQTEILIPRTLTSRTPPTTPGFFDFSFSPGRGGGFGFIPPGFPSPGIFERTPRRRKGKRKLERTPSLFSLLTGFESSFELSGEQTGLIARPILKRKKKKKRRNR